MSLSAEDWEVIHIYLEEADKKDIKSITKHQIKRERQIPKRFVEEDKPAKSDIPKPKPKKRDIPMKRPKRLNRCFKCESCLKPDCRKCIYCKDMKKYGGKGTKKQSCMERPKCLRTQHFEYKNKRRNTPPTTEKEKVDD